MLRAAFTRALKEAKKLYTGRKRKREEDFEGNLSKRNNVNGNYPSVPAKNRKERKGNKKRQKKEMAKERNRQCGGVVNTVSSGHRHTPNKVVENIRDLKVEWGK